MFPVLLLLSVVDKDIMSCISKNMNISRWSVILFDEIKHDFPCVMINQAIFFFLSAKLWICLMFICYQQVWKWINSLKVVDIKNRKKEKNLARKQQVLLLLLHGCMTHICTFLNECSSHELETFRISKVAKYLSVIWKWDRTTVIKRKQMKT